MMRVVKTTDDYRLIVEMWPEDCRLLAKVLGEVSPSAGPADLLDAMSSTFRLAAELLDTQDKLSLETTARALEANERRALAQFMGALSQPDKLTLDAVSTQSVDQ